ncbi:DUF3040 domain-containing protein [Pseudarthrobacter sp. NS4]|uniref:DUF3040 domain-containing protein n=1 Tax=Pseudarthrobacter sp. NS4 TaxID=2973976 RepID=UPI0021611926|nr:DUF3040 domain-containing protein [Pseudarthrobacter sp. NS4]
MALSDEERRRLEKLEQDLAASDPDLARELQSGLPGSGAAARPVYAILAALAGFALIIVGIVTRLTVTGVVGFLLMGAGVYWFLSALHWRDRTR